MKNNFKLPNKIYFNKILNWVEKQNFKYFFLLYSGGELNQFPKPHNYKLVFGASNKHDSLCNSFNEIDSFISNSDTFGILSYDLKNELDNFQSGNTDNFPFPNILFLKPDFQFSIHNDLNVNYTENCSDLIVEILQNIDETPSSAETYVRNVSLEPDVPDNIYIENVKKIQLQIIEGNVYEMNYCRNYSFKTHINPFEYYKLLAQESPSPFSCLVKIGDKFIISNSMERFVTKAGQNLTSQPIKGTRANLGNILAETKELSNSEKDIAENLMIVDLVRNDLNRVSKNNSVKVDELFGIYSYSTVHQMISSISSSIPQSLKFSEIIKALFPMGSMTGAPKISAINLIEKFENFKRGVYSGSIGYINSDFDFDFNVVIRTALYDKKRGYVHIPVGSAITIDSVPEEELAECNVKIEKLIKLLERVVVNQ